MNEIRMRPHSNKADFSRSYQGIDSDGQAVDLTGATIAFSARDPDTRCEVLSASTTDGKITISTTVWTLAFAASDFGRTCGKEYEVGCTITQNDFKRQEFIGVWPIIDGIVS